MKNVFGSFSVYLQVVFVIFLEGNRKKICAKNVGKIKYVT